MFFDGHLHAFAYYGGVFPLMVYDNLKAAVAKVLRGRDREEQYQFKLFRAHYTFTARFCNVARGNEKGGVEGLVKNARNNLLVPIPEVADFEALNDLLLAGCERMSEQVIGGREEQRPIEACFTEEKSYLLALPAEPYVAEKQLTTKVDKYQTVRVDKVRYSVPTKYVGLRVTVGVGCAVVKIMWGREVIATHKRCFTANHWVMNPMHYLELLQRKVGGLEHARPLKAWRKSWSASHDRLWGRLRQKLGERDDSRAFIDVLMLYREHGKQDVEAVLARADELGVADVASLRLMLHEKSPRPGQALGAEQLPERCRQQHEPPDTSKYDRLTGGSP